MSLISMIFSGPVVSVLWGALLVPVGAFYRIEWGGWFWVFAFGFGISVFG